MGNTDYPSFITDESPEKKKRFCFRQLPPAVYTAISGTILAIIFCSIVLHADGEQALSFGNRHSAVDYQTADDARSQSMQKISESLLIGTYRAKEDEEKAFTFHADGTFDGYFNKKNPSVTGATYRLAYDEETIVVLEFGANKQAYQMSFDTDNNVLLTDVTSGKSWTLILQ